MTVGFLFFFGQVTEGVLLLMVVVKVGLLVLFFVVFEYALFTPHLFSPLTLLIIYRLSAER